MRGFTVSPDSLKDFFVENVSWQDSLMLGSYHVIFITVHNSHNALCSVLAFLCAVVSLWTSK